MNMCVLEIIRYLPFLLLFFLFKPFLVKSIPSSRENSPSLDLDSILNLSPGQYLQFDDKPSISSSTAIVQPVEEQNSAKEKVDRKAKRRKYMQNYHEIRKKENPNLGKDKWQERKIKISKMTEEERQKEKEKNRALSRKNYSSRKERLGYRRKQHFVMKQIKEKVQNNIATPEESTKYFDYLDRKKRSMAKSRMKMRALQGDPKPRERKPRKGSS